MPYNNIDKIKNILNNLPSQNSLLDYKVIEYDITKNGNQTELIKDVLAMLNSIESYEKDKFIILGVTDKKYINGLNNLMTDDNQYQSIFDTYISPRPIIETGDLQYSNKLLGYIYFSGNNKFIPYEVRKEKKVSKRTLSIGASFIRKGSVNMELLQDDRETLILKRSEKNPNENNLFHAINKITHAKIEINNKNKNSEGTITIDPSSNNGYYTIGIKAYKFTPKFEVASNDTARIYDYSRYIHIAKVKNFRENPIFNDLKKFNKKNIQDLDFSSSMQSYRKSDLGVLVNKYGNIALIYFDVIESESHVKEKDLLKFTWQIYTYN